MINVWTFAFAMQSGFLANCAKRYKSRRKTSPMKHSSRLFPTAHCVSVSFGELAKGAAWDDYVEYHFRCLHCDEKFLLHAETYHGSGGYWEPQDPKSVRANVTN